MDTTKSIAALAALAQETRLAVFRLLVKAGPEGLCAGDIADALAVRQNTMSANLAVLSRAGLVRGERQGRAIIYRAEMETMGALLAFLLQDCCGGQPAHCGLLLDELCGADRGGVRRSPSGPSTPRRDPGAD
jgi:DNA-binding transcriptional ArsR family regulator|tara:strand:- start:7046 stop:7441 length:396 start_codon:yes stop_codon:yes gene_type:complete